MAAEEEGGEADGRSQKISTTGRRKLPMSFFQQTNTGSCCELYSRRGYDARVDSRDLTVWQASRLREQVGRELRFVGKLCARMQALGFGPADPLYQAANKARNALQELHVAAHYASCRSGVGKG